MVIATTATAPAGEPDGEPTMDAYPLDARPATPPADFTSDPRWVTLRDDGSPFVCGDRYVVVWGGAKDAPADRPTFDPEQSAWFGHGCVAPVPWLGAACKPHGDAFFGTGPAVEPPARPASSGGPGRRTAKDPEVVALIREATTYLNDMAAKRAAGSVAIPDFILTLIADRERKGPAYFRVTENMAAAIVKCRDASARPERPTRERDAEANAWVIAHARDNDFARSLAGGLARYGSLTDGQYAAVLRNVDRDAERAAPVAGAAPVASATEGWYKVGDDVFKVQVAHHGSGNLYAKRLVVTGPGEASWEYAPGMVRRLTDADRLSVEDAAAFGRLYGVCAVCGRTLTDEASIAAGIGPVCIRKVSA